MVELILSLKYHIHITYLLILLFFSCNLPTMGYGNHGIKFEIYNRTEEQVEHAKVIIGGIDASNEFIQVDTFTLPSLKVGVQFIPDNIEEKRWRPDLEKIEQIGNGKACFKLQFENKQARFINSYGDTSEPIFIDLYKHNGQIEGRFGNVKISIGRFDDSNNLDSDYLGGSIYGMDF